MSSPFVGEIRMFGGSFPPKGNAFCNGDTMQIRQNTALFSILGVTYGGNGTTTYNLPNLQGRAAIGMGQGPGLTPRFLGETGGVPNVTLQLGEMATHSHSANATAANGDSPSPSNAIWSASGSGRFPDATYQSSGNATMSPNATSQTGGSQPHNNMPPYQAVNFIIALVGVFPPRN